MKISVIGSQGQVGSELVSAALAKGWDVQSLDHTEVDVTDPQSLRTALGVFAPVSYTHLTLPTNREV